ncbi:hypothetical protein EVAR_23687_1 [Eumeta japonica]|uniref:Uncharacterized protein n=1 Tax=Eumeta variegata TaxID=151549 RepID=A0A4C1VIS0_EUMVA|nr:hypothetical protein EVAR_23687_1 [Eumeta japonica]
MGRVIQLLNFAAERIAFVSNFFISRPRDDPLQALIALPRLILEAQGKIYYCKLHTEIARPYQNESSEIRVPSFAGEVEVTTVTLIGPRQRRAVTPLKKYAAAPTRESPSLLRAELTRKYSALVTYK